MRPAIAQFNSVANYRRLHAVLCLMLEEIVMLVEGVVGDGLQAKARAAIPLWGEWCEWNHLHRNGAQLLHNNPRVAETDLVLEAAAAGCEPCEILRQVMELRKEDDPAAQPAPHTPVLDTFNDFAEFKAMETEMWLRIEEICMAIDNDQGEELGDKCATALPSWELWIEWNRAHNAEFKTEEPKQMQITLLLQIGVLGWGPAEIRLRLQQLRDKNGWAEASPIEAAKLHPAEAALGAWRN